MCTGCYACQNVCPKNCIKLQENEEGFRVPIVDEEACIDCGLCEKVCPIDQKRKTNDFVPKAYACYVLDYAERAASVTAGVCFAVGKTVIARGGVVYGAVGSMVKGVKHTRCITEDELKETRGSKYLQSEIGFCYKEAENDLKEGKMVLFTGTPCQIAGLYGYLRGKSYSNLFTIDLICHGVPSAKAFRMSEAEIEKREGKEIEDFYRDKSQGWAPTYFSHLFKDGTVQTQIGTRDSFNHGFITNILTRRSCQKCKYANIKRVADLTVGDFFDKKMRADFDPDNKGLSLVTVNSGKGEALFHMIQNRLFWKEQPIEEVSVSSEHLARSPKANVYRRTFFYLLEKYGFRKAIRLNEPGNIFEKQLRRVYGCVCYIYEKLSKDGFL